MKPRDLLEKIATKASGAQLYSSASTSIVSPNNLRPKSGNSVAGVSASNFGASSAQLHQKYQLSRPKARPKTGGA